MIVREFREGDIEAIFADVRMSDYEEWRLSAFRLGLGGVPFDALLGAAVASGRLSRVLVDAEGDPLCAWGVGWSGCAWLVGTTEGQRVAHRIQRHFKAGIQELHQHFEVLQAHAWNENTLHHHWMERLGFIRSGPSPWLGPEFTLFLRRKT